MENFSLAHRPIRPSSIISSLCSWTTFDLYKDQQVVVYRLHKRMSRKAHQEMAQPIKVEMDDLEVLDLEMPLEVEVDIDNLTR